MECPYHEFLVEAISRLRWQFQRASLIARSNLIQIVGQCEIARQRPVPAQRPKSADAQVRTVRP